MYLLGLVQPHGAIMPLAEAQSRWAADLLDGTATLPTRQEMAAEIAGYKRRRVRR
jgi:dimethylaniline monooxygenase (N-oxide forming)